MDLIHALRLDQASHPPRLAFVGAGGKTTAIFACARQLARPVLVTATTHLAVHQCGLADQHYFVDEVRFSDLEKNFPPGITLLTGALDRDTDRTLGVSAEALARIHALAEARHIPLLIEADGSRQLPLKAPAAHEPPIPEFVDTVVVVAGLRGLGRPLSPAWVHRPEIFAALLGLQPGAIITPAALARVLAQAEGGLKHIPPAARRIALLNQADTPVLQARGAEIAAQLLPIYDAVIIGSVNPAAAEPPAPAQIHAVHQPIAAVILAAGEARRFGQPKQLLDWQGKPLIWHVAQKAVQAGMSPVLVVCGAEMAAIHRALADLPVERVYNRDWQQGQGTSVRVGADAVNGRCGGILFMLADQPQISVSLLQALIQAHAQRLPPIIGPLIDGQRANPVLFDRVTFADLSALTGEAGGRQLFAKYGVVWVPWHDPVPLLDVDTPEDYARLLALRL